MECRRECQNSYNKSITNLVSSSDTTVNNRLDYGFSYIKSQKNNYCGVAPLKQGNTTLSQPQVKAETLNKIFSSLFITEDISSPVPDKSPYSDILTIHSYT